MKKKIRSQFRAKMPTTRSEECLLNTLARRKKGLEVGGSGFIGEAKRVITPHSGTMGTLNARQVSVTQNACSGREDM